MLVTLTPRLVPRATIAPFRALMRLTIAEYESGGVLSKKTWIPCDWAVVAIALRFAMVVAWLTPAARSLVPPITKSALGLYASTSADSRPFICQVRLPGTPALWMSRSCGSIESRRDGHGFAGHAVRESPRATKRRIRGGPGPAIRAGAGALFGAGGGTGA